MKKVTILAQTPPPFHGQSVMQQYLVDVKWDWCEKEHIRLDYSKSIRDVSSFQLGKLFKLARIIFRMGLSRIRKPIDVLYYPPAGPNRVPLYRDICTLLFAKLFARKIVLHFHAGGLSELILRLTKVERFFAYRAFRHVDAAILLLPWLKTEADWFSPKQVYIVPNGIEDTIRELVRRPVPEKITILFVGNLKDEKGIFILLGAAVEMKKSGRRFEIRVMGEAHSESVVSKMKEIINNNSLQNDFILLGGMTGEKKWAEFHRANIFCLPTYATEAMPVSILEAMMFSLPVVTTDWRAIPDMITDGKEGYLVKVRDEKALAHKLSAFIDTPALCDSMGAAARKKFEDHFSINHHLFRMEQVFKAVS